MMNEQLRQAFCDYAYGDKIAPENLISRADNIDNERDVASTLYAFGLFAGILVLEVKAGRVTIDQLREDFDRIVTEPDLTNDLKKTMRRIGVSDDAVSASRVTGIIMVRDILNDMEGKING